MTKIDHQLDEQEARWFAVYTRFKAEKEVERLLGRKEIECYVPIRTYARRYGRRIAEVKTPLINCYVFVKIAKPDYVRVLETESVQGFVKFGTNLLSIPEREINLLKRIVGDAPEDLEFYQNEHFEKGDLVQVIGGSLTGLTGKLVETKGAKRFLVEMETLGFAFTMSVEKGMLEKIEM
jgi:transcription antitermination factor NusG